MSTIKNVLFLVDHYRSPLEEKREQPFLGSEGLLFGRMLRLAGWPGFDALAGNKYLNEASMRATWEGVEFGVVPIWPTQKKSAFEFFVRKGEAEVSTEMPTMRVGSGNLYVRAEWEAHLLALREKLREHFAEDTLIVAIGRFPTWFLGLGDKIDKVRGWAHVTPYGRVIPTHHPDTIQRQYKLRSVTILDLAKALREWRTGGVPELEREIWTEPTIDDLWDWWARYGEGAERIAVDIETLHGQIAEVGFAAGSQHALHIPFVWEERRGREKRYANWWSEADEVKAWRFVEFVLGSDIPKIGQNFKFDVFWLVEEFGFLIKAWRFDTMVLAHSWQLELKRSLNELASIALPTATSWKSMRSFRARDADDE